MDKLHAYTIFDSRFYVSSTLTPRTPIREAVWSYQDQSYTQTNVESRDSIRRSCQGYDYLERSDSREASEIEVEIEIVVDVVGS